MIQSKLDYIKENSAEIFVSYSNGYLDSRLNGTGEEPDVFDHLVRLAYLYGIVDEMYLSGTSVYVGEEVITDTDVETIYGKIWHYNGIFSADLSDYSSITADAGDSGTTGGSTGSAVSSDNYRADSVAVSSGSNTVTFSSPLSTTDYILDVRVVTAGGYEQRNLVISTKTKNGFVVSDVLQAGTLYYSALVSV